MKPLSLFFIAAGFCGSVLAQQTEPKDSTQIQTLNEVLLKATKAKAQDPITQSNLTAQDLAPLNLGQDMPYLIQNLPGVVATSDAGAGIGYTGLRVRGSDATRVNVSINGIPYNDAESQGVFWVNLPDLGSSVESLQLQRGVGSSAFGPGAFGASLNLSTARSTVEPSLQLQSSGGSFNTQRHNLKFSTGDLGGGISFSGRLSKINSDGYIERASSDLGAYWLQGDYESKRSKISLIGFGGREVTYQSWYGIDQATLDNNRRFNPAGAQYDDQGNLEGFYDQQVDNYKQDHLQFLWSQDLGARWDGQLSLNYTHGRGYFEEYIDSWYAQNIAFNSDANLSTYGLSSVVVDGQNIDATDLVRRRWLNNNFYAINAHLNYKDSDVEWTSGVYSSYYGGDHFGELIWARYAPEANPRMRYYSGNGDKNETSVFSKINWRLDPNWSIYADLQERWISYRTSGITSDLLSLAVNQTYAFFNPKFGVTRDFGKDQLLYLSFGRSHREPRRSDFEQGVFTPERLDDFELGWRHKGASFRYSAVAYYMRYENQLVLTGAIDNSGAPIRETSGQSYRTGLELEGTWRLNEHWSMSTALALSQNKNVDYVASIDGALRNLGVTDLSFAPSVIASGSLVYEPLEGARLAWTTRYVGDQYMSNTESPVSELPAYTVHDFTAAYELPEPWIGKSMSFQLLANNVFSAAFSNNGYYYTYDDDFSVPGQITTIEGTGYYPQALFNLLIGATIAF
ncbi:MAG: TonB-dependent receptor [Flavobacteriaceae bacterium]